MSDESTKTTELDTTTLSGDIRDAVLTEFKHLAKPWQTMTEEEQQRCIDRAEYIGRDLVRRAVDLVAMRGLPALAITVGKFTCEASEMKGTFEAYASDENLLRIRHLCDRRAMFVLADPEEYLGERKPAEPENVGDLAIPKGPQSDPDALATLGQGSDALSKRKRNGKPPVAKLPDEDTSNPPFNGGDDMPAYLDRRAIQS